VLAFAESLIPRRRGISKRSHLLNLAADAVAGISQVALGLVLAPLQAWISAGAVGRALYRLIVSGRRRLEWLTEAQSRTRFDLDPFGIYRRLAPAVLSGCACVAAVLALQPGSWAAASALMAAWALSPLVVFEISRPATSRIVSPLASEDVRYLRAVARQTFRYFEAFVSPEDNHLPPDNFQEAPHPVVARRTSPTNIGLYLLSILSARDFGWIGTLDAVERLEATLATVRTPRALARPLLQLVRHGHPAAARAALRLLRRQRETSPATSSLSRRGCRDLAAAPPCDSARALAGIGDALVLLRRAAGDLAHSARSQIVTRRQIDRALDSFASQLQDVTAATSARGAAPPPRILRGRPLAELSDQAETIEDIARALADVSDGDAEREILVWAKALRACVGCHAREASEAAAAAAAALHPPAGLVRSGNGSRGEGRAFPAGGGGAVARLGRGRDRGSAADRGPATAGDRLVVRGNGRGMDFGFLYDRRRMLFAIGWRESDGALDHLLLRLLASEARLTSFLAIAKGDVPTEHWFALGRSLTPVEQGPR
jgi:cyclic beta-1,2-glucan synthetase